MTGALQSGPGDGEVWQAKVDRRGGDDRGEKKGEEELVQKEDNCLKGERIVRTHVCLWIWHFSMWGNDSKCDLVQILWYFQENMRWAKNTVAEMRARLPVGGGEKTPETFASSFPPYVFSSLYSSLLSFSSWLTLCSATGLPVSLSRFGKTCEPGWHWRDWDDASRRWV